MKRMILLIMALLLIINVMQSQVTIGTLTPPLKGAILDLKQQAETNGVINSTGGLKFPRVSLTGLTSLQPLLSTAEDGAATAATKLQYKGMTVYNVTVDAGANLQEGLYVWDGTQWVLLQAGDVSAVIYAKNGLNLSADNDTVKLGGTLTEPTTINMNGYDIVFKRPAGSTGNIGIGTTVPMAPLDILTSDDPLRLNNVHYTSDLLNPVDAPNAITKYYALQISDGGIVRKSPLVNDESKTFIFTLFNPGTGTPNLTIATGGNDGLGGSLLTWRIGGKDSSYVALPEDGAYIFSFRLYGTATTLSRTNSFYFSSLVDNGQTTTVFDVQEIVLSSSYMTTPAYVPITYTTNLTVAGKKGDKIYFRLAELSDNHTIGWTLNGNTNEKWANRTSMIYWKL